MPVVIVGGGIIGLAVARTVLQRFPGTEVIVLEKDKKIAQQQSGHNSGVVHTGLYYRPGSLKAQLCVAGRELLRSFCRDHHLNYRVCGKVIVAINARDVSALGDITDRALANGVSDVRRISGRELREIEPHVEGLAAVWSPSTAIVDFSGVCGALFADTVALGGRVICGAEVSGIEQTNRGVVLTALQNGEEYRYVATASILCGGLQSDRLARLAKGANYPRIVPFRGEYFSLVPEQRHLIRGLVYPVPDARLPFLGVHFTPRSDGTCLVGPNAVLALAREGYRRRDFRARDAIETITYRGFWSLARRHWRVGAVEVYSSLRKEVYAKRAQRYLPGLQVNHLVRAPAGVRAQAVARDGRLLDDFVIERLGNVVAIRNAPSPAATSSLAIARYVVDECATMF